MANLVKVEQVKNNNEEYNPNETASNIIKLALGVDIQVSCQTKHQGVYFKTIAKGWEYSRQGQTFSGIRMRVEHLSGPPNSRRVEVKDGQIDLDAIKEKFGALKTIADEEAKQRQADQEYRNRSYAVEQEITKAVNHKLGDGGIYINSYSPDAVKISGYVNGPRLIAVEELLGEQSVSIELVVLKDRAIELYRILKGEEKK